ncbi:MarR family winged helix-turn-helix transcriptional regulator [Hugenholtzia roseola]|uniref:MarR family winged helix-turn-helix transcriptional regulator n=1 Tax=Hugenholtzia roseola TaxID=1002 RepID=UPI0004188D24|nr:MarR family transcriptional regulator [Hugenholtzia roseola]
MKIEDELQMSHFKSEMQKAHLNILFTASWLRSRMLPRFKAFGISNEQFNVLRILRGQNPKSLCVRDIKERMIDRNSNTTRIIDKLLEKEYVSKQTSERDKREIEVYISEKGLALLKEIDDDFEKDNPHLAGLSASEAQLLNALLDKLRDTP